MPAGSAAGGRAGVAGTDRAAQALRHGLAGGAREGRCREAHGDGEVGSRRPEIRDANDLVQLDADAVTLSRVVPAVPFRAALVQLIESRIRVEDVNSQKAAATLTQVTKDLAALKTRLEAGIAGGSSADALRLNQEQAAMGAQATQTIRAGLTEWFGFYNLYDPLFTWWIGMPFKKIDAALSDYSTFLAGQSRGGEFVRRGSRFAADRGRSHAQVQLGP